MTTTSSSPSVLLLGNRRQSLTVSRQLAAAGWRVIAARNRGDDRDTNVHRSRAVSEVWEHTHWRDDPTTFDEEFDGRLAAQPEIAVVFPIDEAALREGDRQRDRLATRSDSTTPVFALAPHDALAVCLDKGATLDLCDRVGVATHRATVVGGVELRAALDHVGLPAIVKPMDAETLHFGVKAVIVGTDTERRQLLADQSLTGRTVMVQRFATGARHNVYFAAAHGRIVGAGEVRIDRTDRVDGTGLAVAGSTVAPTTALHRETEALVEALGYHGVGCAQFMFDASTGESSFLELNPRLGANFAIVERAGLPLAGLAVDLAVGGGPEPETPRLGVRPGVTFAWSFGALAGTRFERRQGVVSTVEAARLAARTLVEGVRADGHITWSWRDPVPTLLEFSRPLTHRATAPTDG